MLAILGGCSYWITWLPLAGLGGGAPGHGFIFSQFHAENLAKSYVGSSTPVPLPGRIGTSSHTKSWIRSWLHVPIDLLLSGFPIFWTDTIPDVSIIFPVFK